MENFIIEKCTGNQYMIGRLHGRHFGVSGRTYKDEGGILAALFAAAPETAAERDRLKLEISQWESLGADFATQIVRVEMGNTEPVKSSKGFYELAKTFEAAAKEEREAKAELAEALQNVCNQMGWADHTGLDHIWYVCAAREALARHTAPTGVPSAECDRLKKQVQELLGALDELTSAVDDPQFGNPGWRHPSLVKACAVVHRHNPPPGMETDKCRQGSDSSDPDDHTDHSEQWLDQATADAPTPYDP